MPEIGDKVFIVPQAGLAVQVEGIYGRFLPAAGQDVIWSEWYHRRQMDGSISIGAPVAESKKKDK